MIAKVDFVPELEREQEVYFLVDEDNRLLAAETVELARKEVEEIFGQELEVGQEFFEDENGEKYYFANMSLETLPEGWKMMPYREFDAEACEDYEAIVAAMEKLGYSAE